MRTLKAGLGIALAGALAACGRSEPAGAVDDGLRRDLALAEAAQHASLTLPGTAGPRTQVVSAVELVPRAAPVPTRAAASPRKPERARVKAKRLVRRAPVVAPAPAPEPVVEVVEVAAATPAPEAAAEAAPEPVIENPRPVPAAPVYDEPAREPERGGGWGGVVIRGGGVDGDHCERDRPRRGGLGGMISINVQGPMGRGTFPRY